MRACSTFSPHMIKVELPPLSQSTMRVVQYATFDDELVAGLPQRSK